MSDARLLRFGTQEVEPAIIRLAAGPLTADLVGGDLVAIRYGGTEVLRAVAYVVRDRDWGTVAPLLDAVSIDQTGDAFSVTYQARCIGREGASLSYTAIIEGGADGMLSFAVEAVADTAFETNRCGFCVLHPIVDLAGRPARVEHADGSIEESVFPDAIEPWQPFKDMRAITHAIGPGLQATCRMEGDTFEMEDQRNWSDASYKTYVRPLALPWPYVLPAGEPQRQRVTLTIAGDGPAAAQPARAGGTVAIDLGESTGTMPRFGLVVGPDDIDAVTRRLDRLREIAPQSLLLHYDPTIGHEADHLRRLAVLREASGVAEAVLECVVPGVGDPRSEIEAIAALVRDAGLRLDAIAVSPSVDRQSTPPGSAWPPCPPLEDIYAAVRAAFPGLALGGGMFSYFTELNRKRPPVERLDFVTHCTCPIVHAADDRSVMQSLEALPFIVRSARGIIGERPYRIGPSTIGMRQNPYGSRTFDNPEGRRITMTHADPRQRGLFAAAWTIGYVAATIDGGLDTFTGGGLLGPFGLMPTDPSDDRVYPAFHVARGLAALAGLPRLTVRSTAPGKVLGFAARAADGTVLWLANITGEEHRVQVTGGFAKAVRFDHETGAARTAAEPPAAALPAPEIVLPPYAFARLEH